MADEFPIDPALQSLEARVAGLRPKLSEHDAHDLLYQCAFKAGQKSAAARARRWQFVSAAMAALVVAVSLAGVGERSGIARQDRAATDLRPSSGVQPPYLVPRAASRTAPASLDAWQVRNDTAASFETALTRFSQRDTSSRWLAVGSTMHAVDDLR